MKSKPNLGCMGSIDKSKKKDNHLQSKNICYQNPETAISDLLFWMT